MKGLLGGRKNRKTRRIALGLMVVGVIAIAAFAGTGGHGWGNWGHGWGHYTPPSPPVFVYPSYDYDYDTANVNIGVEVANIVDTVGNGNTWNLSNWWPMDPALPTLDINISQFSNVQTGVNIWQD